MGTSNDIIQDALLGHQVQLLRFGKGLRDRINALLARSEPELRRRIRSRLERIAALNNDPGPATTERLEQMRRMIVALQKDTWTGINGLVRTQLVGLATGENIFISGLISDALPVIYKPAIATPRELRAIVYARPFQNQLLRGWLSGFRLGDQRRMMEEIRQGLLFSETPTQIGRRIFGTSALNGADGVRQITRRGAQTLAQTATSAISNGVRSQVYKMNRKVIPKEVFVATLDSRTTPVCQSLDGDIFPVGEGPVPPIHMNCRSIRAPVVDGRRLGTRPASANFRGRLGKLRGPARRREVAKLIGRVPAETTYQDFLRRSGAAFQDNVLGPTRGRLFRAGEFDVKGFVDNSGRRLSLRELYETKPSAFQNLGIPAPAP